AVRPHAAYLLAADRARVLYLDPLPEDTAASAARVASARGEKTGAKTKGASAARPLPGADFGRAPPLPPVREIVDAERFTLPNGLRVALLPSLTSPTVTATLGFGGGVGA